MCIRIIGKTHLHSFCLLANLCINSILEYNFFHLLSLSRTIYDVTEYKEQNPGVTDLPISSDWYISIGRLDDKLTVEDFAKSLALHQTEATVVGIADNLGFNLLKTQIDRSRGRGVMTCGSPNEVAPDPTLDDYFEILTNPGGCAGCIDTLIQSKHQDQKRTVWTLATLEAEDQFCQRMAWALYEHCK